MLSVITRRWAVQVSIRVAAGCDMTVVVPPTNLTRQLWVAATLFRSCFEFRTGAVPRRDRGRWAMWARRVAHLDRTKRLWIIYEYRSTSYVPLWYRFHTFYPANARGTAPDPLVGRPPVGGPPGGSRHVGDVCEGSTLSYTLICVTIDASLAPAVR